MSCSVAAQQRGADLPSISHMTCVADSWTRLSRFRQKMNSWFFICKTERIPVREHCAVQGARATAARARA
jgi:hypothetical protein